ncbi:MAG TPA: long-chain fatty acid--CoA ligase, partial [Acidimicrobiia bacterium]|nr:long-chain fatty acid--CoA ligase [Acidimicrobiia bacterium]
MQSTMQDFPLSVGMIFRHGRTVFGDSEVVTFEGDTTRRASFAEVSERVDRLAAALRRLGVESGDRVATFMWNTQEHLEAYFAIPCVGGVLHTLNIRLFPEQLAYIVNHAEDRIVIVGGDLVPLLAKLAPELTTVEYYVVVGDADTAALEGNRAEVLRYDELLASAPPGITYPEIDERAAAAMCYTSGTTGNPKGVVYSHRSTFLHSLGVLQANVLGFTDRDRVLPIVPMFHANAWGLPYAAWMAGADLIMPNRYLQAEPLARLIEQERPTCAGAVPTIWTELLNYAETHPTDVSSFRQVCCGGSAVPRALMERFQEQLGVCIVQGWGMTETSPLAAVSWPPKGVELGTTAEMDWRARTGRLIAGVELRLVDDDGNVLPWDGQSVGEIEVRGPWVTGAYYKDADPAKFDDGWLRTGDIASVTERGYIQISDRAKDVIKSGGEWISSVELEVHLMAHPGVLEAAVIAVPDAKWSERPLACVVLKAGDGPTADELREFLGARVARWQLPERWTFIE